MYSRSSLDMTVLATDPDGDDLTYTFDDIETGFGSMAAHPSRLPNRIRYTPPTTAPYPDGFASTVLVC